MQTPEGLTDWLLAGDPSVAWRAQRDLLDAAPATVAATRARVADEGWGQRLLAEQAEDGGWGGGLYSPKWTSTTYTLLLLAQLGLPSDDPQARRGASHLLDGARWIDDGCTFGISQTLPETCITSIVIRIAVAFERVDERVTRALDWLLGQQLGDGGWNCETVRSGSRHGSFHTTILALEALDAWQQAGPDGPAIGAAGDRGREFFCAHGLYRSHRTGEPVDPALTRPVFPPGWRHDVLRGLDHFRAASAPTDDRLAGAVGTLVSRRRDDGTWPAYRPHAGRYWFPLETPRHPSRLNTLRALRVLRWWDA